MSAMIFLLLGYGVWETGMYRLKVLPQFTVLSTFMEPFQSRSTP